MGCTYVNDFDFKKTAGDMSAAKSGYKAGGEVKKAGYARGGSVVEKATGERYPSREAMVRHEAKETPRMQKEELIQRSKTVAPVARVKAVAPVAARRSVPVAAREPMIAMKKGGSAKVGKVMGEYAAGKLHSGGKSGPVVTNPKQAIAIGLSEARRAAKR